MILLKYLKLNSKAVRYIFIFATFFAIVKADNKTYYYDLWQRGIVHSFQEKEINVTVYPSVFDSGYNSKKVDRFCKEYKKSKQSCI